MVMRRKTIDNSVRYNPKSEQTKEKNIKPKTIKAGSLPRKQNKNISQNIKKSFLKIYQQVHLVNLQISICTIIVIIIRLFVYEYV